VNRLPWKFCPYCNEISYTAATKYRWWPCPKCGKELKDEPEYLLQEAIAVKNEHLEKATIPPKDNI
jgi:DNA-directed RNA polymerase subunit M/transcription elongation factor TFIIS